MEEPLLLLDEELALLETFMLRPMQCNFVWPWRAALLEKLYKGDYCNVSLTQKAIVNHRGWGLLGSSVIDYCKDAWLKSRQNLQIGKRREVRWKVKEKKNRRIEV